MASLRMIRRELKRTRLQSLLPKRKSLRAQLNDPALDYNEKFVVLAQIEAMPRDSSHVRLSHRCRITGRARGVYRKFGLGRNELRRRVMKGETPGVVKSSW